MLCLVSKAFIAEEGQPPLKVGTEFESSTLRWGDRLIEQRYLTPVNQIPQWCEVMKPMRGLVNGKEKDLYQGDVVNTSSWPHVLKMIEQRRLRPTEPPVKKARKPRKKRKANNAKSSN